MESTFHQRVISVIKRIPRGKVATYGQIAALAGSPRAARQVVRALHTSSRKEKLPWHRVVSGKGQISLKRGYGYDEQKERLEKEGVTFTLNGSIDFDKFLWEP